MLVLYVPAGHAVQAAMEVDAVLLLYVPAGHNVQTPALPMENEPAAQSVHAAAPATEYFPAAQAAHFDMPVLAANVPAAQFCASELHNQTQLYAKAQSLQKQASHFCWRRRHSYLASACSFGPNIMVVRPRRTRFASGAGCGPGVGVVRASRTLRARNS